MEGPSSSEDPKALKYIFDLFIEKVSRT